MIEYDTTTQGVTGIGVSGACCMAVEDGSGEGGYSLAGSALAVSVTAAGEQPFCSASTGTMTCGSPGKKWGASSHTYQSNYGVNTGVVDMIGLT